VVGQTAGEHTTTEVSTGGMGREGDKQGGKAVAYPMLPLAAMPCRHVCHQHLPAAHRGSPPPPPPPTHTSGAA
jgi:hypothetical protein